MTSKSQIVRKEQVISNLIEARQKVLKEVSKLSEAEQDQVFLGIWSIKDLVAHLIGWDKTNLQAVKSVLNGQVPSFYEHRDPDWRTYNAMLVKKYMKGSTQELIATAKRSQERLLQLLQTIPPEHLNEDFGVRFRGYKVTIQRLLEAETEDEQIHYKQITDYFKAPK